MCCYFIRSCSTSYSRSSIYSIAYTVTFGPIFPSPDAMNRTVSSFACRIFLFFALCFRASCSSVSCILCYVIVPFSISYTRYSIFTIAYTGTIGPITPSPYTIFTSCSSSCCRCCSSCCSSSFCLKIINSLSIFSILSFFCSYS